MAVAWGACSHDWDSYDPRLGGGAGGAGTSSASSAGGAGPGSGTGGGDPGSGGGGGDPGTGGGGGAPLPGGTHLCSRSFGDFERQIPRAVAAAPNGDALVTGFFDGTMDLGDGPLASAGGQDLFVAAFDPACAVRWSQRHGDAALQTGYGVAADQAGGALVIGEVAGVVSFGGDTFDTAETDQEDTFVLKVGPAGDHVWSRSFGDALDQFGVTVAVGPDGDAAVIVDVNGAVDLGCGEHVPQSGIDVVVARLDGADGTCVWSRLLPGPGYTHGRSLAVDAEGSVIVAGGFEGSIDVLGQSLASAGETDAFVAKLGPDGALRWARGFGSAGITDEDYARGVAVDGAGHVLVMGRFKGSLDVGLGPMVSAGERDVFLLKLNPDDGGPVWARAYGGPLDDNAHGMAVDAGGGVVLAGRFMETASFGGDPLVSAGGDDVFIASYDAMGQHRWSRGFGSPGGQRVMDVAVTPGAVIVTGSFEGVLDLGGGPLVSQGLEDVFVARFAP